MKKKTHMAVSYLTRADTLRMFCGEKILVEERERYTYGFNDGPSCPVCRKRWRAGMALLRGAR